MKVIPKHMVVITLKLNYITSSVLSVDLGQMTQIYLIFKPYITNATNTTLL